MPTPTKVPPRPIALLPNALTLANAGLGLLAISKAVAALARGADQQLFEHHLETACWLIFIAGFLDAIDGTVARVTGAFSDLGAQLDSLADAVTFGIAPAIVAKVLLEHEGLSHPRIHFIAAAAFALMAILRLARFNAEGDDDHLSFRGLPTPAAAGTLVATILMFLSLGGGIETDTGGPTPLGRGLEILPIGWRDALTDYLLLPTILLLLPTLGLLMVSRVGYPHLSSWLGKVQSRRVLVPMVFGALGLYLAPVLVLFLIGPCYVGWGLWQSWRGDRGGTGETGGREAA